MNLYNLMVLFKGEGYITIYIPGIGDTTINYGKPIYLKNAPFKVIEALRQCRNLHIEFRINASQTGAVRIIDFNELQSPFQARPIIQQKQEAVTQAEISSVRSAGTSGPIPVEEVVISEKDDSNIDYSKYTLPSGSFEGKTLAEVDKEGKLKAVYNGFKSRNPEVKLAIEKYYESQLKK